MQRYKETQELTPLEVDETSGLLLGVPFYPSPHFNERPNPHDISLLVIHDTEIVAPDHLPYDQSLVHYLFTYQYDKIKKQYSSEYHRLFPDGKISDVSAHIVIRRNGEIFQYVPFAKRAWHAGVSEFMGQESCNDYSIGIELEGMANRDDLLYTQEQYEALAELSSVLMKAYPAISLDRIVGHEDIARPLHRKSDPGLTFDWPRYFGLIECYL